MAFMKKVWSLVLTLVLFAAPLMFTHQGWHGGDDQAVHGDLMGLDGESCANLVHGEEEQEICCLQMASHCSDTFAAMYDVSPSQRSASRIVTSMALRHGLRGLHPESLLRPPRV